MTGKEHERKPEPKAPEPPVEDPAITLLVERLRARNAPVSGERIGKDGIRLTVEGDPPRVFEAEGPDAADLLEAKLRIAGVIV